MARALYLVLRLGTPAFVINAVINGLIGLAIYGSEPLVAWFGDPSVLGDTLIGTFLVGLLTSRLITPTLARDVQAGLVAGTADDSIWRKVLPEGPWKRAFAVAAVTSALCLGLFVVPGAQVAPDGINGLAVVAFKASTSGLAAVLAIVLTAQRVLIGGPDRTTAYRDALARASAVPDERERWAFEFLDKACVAAGDMDRGCSNSPTWHFVLEGDVDVDHLRAAIDKLCAHYPLLQTRAFPIDGAAGYARRYCYLEHDPVDLLEVRDGSIDALKPSLINHAIDPFTAPNTRFVLVRDAETSHLLIQNHHAAGDGRAYIELFEDLTALLADLEAPIRPATRLPELDALQRDKGELRSLRWRGMRRHFREKRALKRNPPAPLPSNASLDYSGDNGTLHLAVSDRLLEELRPLRKERGVGLNAVLTAAFVKAAHRWGADGGAAVSPINITLIVETRPREAEFRSFANHLASFVVEVPVSAEAELWELARSVHQGSLAERDSEAYLERMVFETFAVSLLPLDAMRKILFEEAELKTHLNYSNLIPLTFPKLEGPGWSAEEVWVTTPTSPRHGLVLTSVHYGGQVVFNLNWRRSVIDESDVRAVGAYFAEAIRETGLEFDPRIVVSGA